MSANEIVERVAEAIAQANREPFYLSPELYREMARAAIRALREPTEAMTRAGVDFALGGSLSGEYRWPDYIGDMHRRQIDVALAPDTPPRPNSDGVGDTEGTGR